MEDERRHAAHLLAQHFGTLLVVGNVDRPAGYGARAQALCDDIAGTRAIDGGPLYNARYVEQWTALLIGVNIRHKIREGTGFRLTYI